MAPPVNANSRYTVYTYGVTYPAFGSVDADRVDEVELVFGPVQP